MVGVVAAFCDARILCIGKTVRRGAGETSALMIFCFLRKIFVDIVVIQNWVLIHCINIEKLGFRRASDYLTTL